MSELPIGGIPSAASPAPLSSAARDRPEDAIRDSRGAALRKSSGPEGSASGSGKVTLQDLQQIIDDLNGFVTKGVRFDLTNDGQDLVIQVVDRDSDEVLRSIPPEQLIAFREGFRELTGILLDDRA